jgi:hypothetical protein
VATAAGGPAGRGRRGHPGRAVVPAGRPHGRDLQTEVGDSLDLLLGTLAGLGVCQPDGTFVTDLATLATRLTEMAAAGEAVVVDGLATRVQRPRGWANQAGPTKLGQPSWANQAGPTKLGQPKGALRRQAPHPHRPRHRGHHHPWRPAVLRRRLAGQLPRTRAAHPVGGRRGPGRDRGRHPHRPGLSRPGQDPHALARPHRRPTTSDRLTEPERAYNREQAGLRALVEQSIGHLAGAWSLRRWRGLLFRVRDVYRVAAALVSLGRWLHRIPT